MTQRVRTVCLCRKYLQSRQSFETGQSWVGNCSVSTHDPKAANDLDGKQQLLLACAAGQVGRDNRVMRV